jgi:hypothetical protein
MGMRLVMTVPGGGFIARLATGIMSISRGSMIILMIIGLKALRRLGLVTVRFRFIVVVLTSFTFAMSRVGCFVGLHRVFSGGGWSLSRAGNLARPQVRDRRLSCGRIHFYFETPEAKCCGASVASHRLAHRSNFNLFIQFDLPARRSDAGLARKHFDWASVRSGCQSGFGASVLSVPLWPIQFLSVRNQN